MNTSPIAIGGIGGSGTRLVAAILMELGFFLGRDLNEANDNLAFTLLFKRLEIWSANDVEFAGLVDIFLAEMQGGAQFSPEQTKIIRGAAGGDRQAHPREWLQQRADAMLDADAAPVQQRAAWGWKEPNTHLFLDRLYAALPGLKYIHVMRDGQEMAYSSNQNQPRLWGSSILGGGPVTEVSPRYALRYWCAVHRRIFRIVADAGKADAFLLLNFDNLCVAPQVELRKLFTFLGIAPAQSLMARCAALINKPPRKNVAPAYAAAEFDAEDVAFSNALMQTSSQAEQALVGFVIGGAQKSGTTSLHACIAQHPQIGMASRKEVHFFDEDRYFTESPPDYARYHAHFVRQFDGQLLGEATPAYMYWQDAPRRMWQYNPDLKWIIILRNPIERAFSHWNMERTRGREPETFMRALELEEARCRTALPAQSKMFSYVDRGYYSEQLRRIWRYFPRQQTLILRHEDFRDHAAATLGRVFDFLDVAPFTPARLEREHVLPYGAALSYAEWSRLAGIFEYDIRSIERMLGWDCGDWLVAPDGLQP